MASIKKKDVTVWVSIISILLSLVTAFGIFIGFKYDKQTTINVKYNDYGIGMIADTGKIVDSKQSAYTKDLMAVDGLTIEIDEVTATVTYKVAFYDAEEEFISMTGDLSTDYDSTQIPDNAEFFRIMITPYAVDGEPVKLNIFNMGKYTSQLDVSFAK